MGPFARQEVLHRPGSLLVAQRERESLDLSPGVQVAVWLDLAEPTPEKFWKGAVLDNSQPVANEPI